MKRVVAGEGEENAEPWPQREEDLSCCIDPHLDECREGEMYKEMWIKTARKEKKETERLAFRIEGADSTYCGAEQFFPIGFEIEDDAPPGAGQSGPSDE